MPVTAGTLSWPHRSAQRAAHDAVAAGEERRAGDTRSGARGHQRGELGDRAVGLLGGVVVPADHGGDDGAVSPRARWTARAPTAPG
jgi:hypothetical protein